MGLIDLIALAERIRIETVEEANDAERVGSLLKLIATEIKDLETLISNLPPSSALPTVSASSLTDFDNITAHGLYAILGDYPGIFIGGYEEEGVYTQMVIWRNTILFRKIVNDATQDIAVKYWQDWMTNWPADAVEGDWIYNPTTKKMGVFQVTWGVLGVATQASIDPNFNYIHNFTRYEWTGSDMEELGPQFPAFTEFTGGGGGGTGDMKEAEYSALNAWKSVKTARNALALAGKEAWEYIDHYDVHFTGETVEDFGAPGLSVGKLAFNLNSEELFKSDGADWNPEPLRAGKFYVFLNQNNKQYRWSGTAMEPMKAGDAVTGETINTVLTGSTDKAILEANDYIPLLGKLKIKWANFLLQLEGIFAPLIHRHTWDEIDERPDISLLATKTEVTSAVTQLIDGATDDTLKKLQDKVTALQAIVGGAAPDGDNLVNTVTELLALFASVPEDVDMALLLAGKVNFTDVYNALDCIVAGKVLDARQGKVLSDAIAALTITVSAKQNQSQYASATLPKAAWNPSTLRQTIAVPGVTNASKIFMYPDTDRNNYLEYAACQVSAISKTTDSVTFETSLIPDYDLTLTIEIRN